MSTALLDYRCEREGTIREHPGLRRREAYSLVGEILYYNGLATKAEAQRFAATVKPGEPATFGPYTFTLTKPAQR